MTQLRTVGEIVAIFLLMADAGSGSGETNGDGDDGGADDSGKNTTAKTGQSRGEQAFGKTSLNTPPVASFINIRGHQKVFREQELLEGWGFLHCALNALK